ncbi:somatostatin receptor type 5-like [Macrobrachium rosenbergii]|uniref:somatostatin receptor type 5-like n=1 Tax=Macrobrachium rosenbergii TaxID=79674 RepID=UPI0034D7723F
MDPTGNDIHRASVPEEIWNVQHTSYMIILPIIIAIGLVLSIVSFIVLRRTKLKANHVNIYFLLLTGADFIIFTVSIPTVKSLNGCNLRSYEYALYFVHVFFTIFYVTQTISLYLILWIAYDRFLAIWNFTRFTEIQKPSVIRMRLTCTILVCILLHLEHLFDVRITCSTVEHCKPGNVTCELTAQQVSSEHNEHTCTDGVWFINDGLHYITEKPMWRQIYWVFYGLLVSALPIIVIVIFNLGIVVAIIAQRFKSVSSTARTQRRDLSRIYIILAISVTFVSCTVPTLVHAAFYAQNIENCHGTYSEEVFRAVAHLLLLAEHMTHFVILGFNQVFWNELKKVASLTCQYTKTFLLLLIGKIDRVEHSDNSNNTTNSPPEPPAAASESPPTAPLPTISIVTDHAEPIKEEVTIDTNLQFSKYNNSTNNDTLESSNSLRPPERSPTVSMITLEEEI